MLVCFWCSQSVRNILREVRAAIRMLSAFENTYLQERQRVEATSQDNRWEFDRKMLFGDIHYMKRILNDIHEMAKVCTTIAAWFMGPLIDGLIDRWSKRIFQYSSLHHLAQSIVHGKITD